MGPPEEIVGDYRLDYAQPGPNAELEEFLWTMLYEAAQMRKGGETLEWAKQDALLRGYVAGWGRPTDHAVVAVHVPSGEQVAAAWVRIHEAGCAFMQADIPEVAIATHPDHRSKGLGGALLPALIAHARRQPARYAGLSLSVRSSNRAVGLYRKVGFTVSSEKIGRGDEISYVMFFPFSTPVSD
ncbi:hypothetical protein DIPPA_29587 [Diplonema papillatum]|nr:hypothetical protein DIPPA_29587 [Diplonema papillatum]